jgi:ferric-dicitrate binding protein FerR (iron transport regulator)
MDENRLWVLIARHLSGEITESESSALQKFLREQPRKQYLLDILQSYYHSPQKMPEKNPEEDALDERRFDSIINRGQSLKDPAQNLETIRTKTFVFASLWKVAAAISGIVLLGGLGYYFLRQPKSPEKILPDKPNEIFSKSGVRTKLTLPDGTQVWLNSGSHLSYSNNYNLGTREVELEGEGFFDVTRDPEHPFIVHAASLNIRVVGTAFNVKSYPRDETVETTLLRGIIEVSRKDNPSGPKVILKPNEKLIFSKQYPNETLNSLPKSQDKKPAFTGIAVITVAKNIPDSNKVETGWVYNRLIFDGDSFQELAGKMERWYNVKISFADKEIERYRFKGAFANESITEALNALQLTANFRYQIDHDEVTLSKK